jgi:hypothetical protein
MFELPEIRFDRSKQFVDSDDDSFSRFEAIVLYSKVEFDGGRKLWLLRQNRDTGIETMLLPAPLGDTWKACCQEMLDVGGRFYYFIIRFTQESGIIFPDVISYASPQARAQAECFNRCLRHIFQLEGGA